MLPGEGGFLRFNFEDEMLPLSPSFGLHILYRVITLEGTFRWERTVGARFYR